MIEINYTELICPTCSSKMLYRRESVLAASLDIYRCTNDKCRDPVHYYDRDKDKMTSMKTK